MTVYFRFCCPAMKKNSALTCIYATRVAYPIKPTGASKARENQYVKERSQFSQFKPETQRTLTFSYYYELHPSIDPFDSKNK